MTHGSLTSRKPGNSRLWRRTVALLSALLAGGLIVAGLSPANAQEDVLEELGLEDVSIAFTGGGFRAHTNHAAWLMSAVENSSLDLNGVMANVDSLASNSGGSWFLTQLAWSQPFSSAISSGDISTYQQTGYLGQLETYYNQYSWSCPSFLQFICDLSGDISPYLALASSAGGTDLSWRDVVNNMVFEPYNMNTTLQNTTTSSTRQPWAQDKSLVLASSVLTQIAILNEQGWLETLDKGFYTTESQPSTSQTTPFGVTVPGGGMRGNSGFLAGNQTFNYGGDSSDPNSGLVSTSIPAVQNTSNLPIIDAASISSAAAGAGASVSALEGLGVPTIAASETAYKAANLAVPMQLGSMTYAPNISSSDGASALANGQYARFADGGYGDNTGVAHLVRHLQDNNAADGFDIVLFDDEDSGVVSNSSGQSYGMGINGAQLFGYGGFPTNQQCFGSHCVEVPSPQVFDSSAALNTAPTWEYSNNGVKMSYGSYQVSTVANDTFGVQAGSTGTVHVFSTYSNVGDVPTSSTTFTDYDQLMDAIQTGVTSNGGWQYLQAALNLPPSAPTAPDAPTAYAGDTTANVTFDEPSSDGGSPVTGYTATASQANTSGTSAAGAKTCSTDGEKSCTITGLKNGRTYRFTVHATNAVGDGPESKKSNLITPGLVDRPKVSLDVKAPKKTKRLTVGKRTRLIRATTNGRISRLRTQCFQRNKAERLSASSVTAQRVDCRFVTKKSKKKGNSKVRIAVKPKCSQGLRVKVVMKSTRSGYLPERYRRVWRVKRSPSVAC